MSPIIFDYDLAYDMETIETSQITVQYNNNFVIEYVLKYDLDVTMSYAKKNFISNTRNNRRKRSPSSYWNPTYQYIVTN